MDLFEESYNNVNDERCKFKNDNFGYWSALKCFSTPFETGSLQHDRLEAVHYARCIGVFDEKFQ